MTGETVKEQELSALARQAGQLARSGNAEQAEALYRRVLAASPDHLAALTFLGLRAFQRGELTDSEAFVRRALAAQPRDAVLHQNLGLVLNAAGEYERAADSFRTASELAPDHILIALYLGDALLSAGDEDAALNAFCRAFRLEPRLAQPRQWRGLAPDMQVLCRRGMKHREACLRAAQESALTELMNGHETQSVQRLRQFAAVRGGRQQPEFPHPLHKPGFLFFPGITSRPWYETALFEWVSAVEAAAARIRAELLNVLQYSDKLTPYVDKTQAQIKDWEQLAGSTTWSSFHLYKEGTRVDENCVMCPKTAAILDSLPLVDCPGQAPEAFFSILRPGTHIPPHFGLANSKLAVHLPLVVPPDCAIRVGDETRTWREGRCLVFDDSYEHEAWNRSTETRAVLIFEVWHPDLTELEKEAVRRVVATINEFHARCVAA